MIPRVSVLLTFYNQERYVDKAFESILSQKTDFGVKIIVGDDGSSDRTRDIVKKWISRYPECIELHVMPECGDDRVPGFRASQNRLNLLRFVDTDYFIFLDGDDHFCSERKLQRQVEILDDETNCDCIACGHNTWRLYNDGTRSPATDPSLMECKLTAKDYWSSLYIHTDSLLFRKTLIPKIDHVLLENNFNDNMITFSALQYGKIYYIPDMWAVYLQTDTGIWTSGNEMINLIRNLIFYDVSCRINPRLRIQTFNRFGYTWEELYKIRKDIDPTNLRAYYAEAADKGLKNVMLWINYRDLSIPMRSFVAIKTFFIKCVRPFTRHLF